MAKTHYHWTDAEIAEMVQMARAGDTYKTIGAHFGVNEKRIRTAFELRGLKITELVWEPGGVKRETLLKMLARRATKIEMQREIGCSKVTLRQRMEELGVIDYRTAPPPKPKRHSLPSGDRGFREGKNARSSRVARLKRIENPPTVVPPHAVGIKRSGPPRGCSHVINNPADWARVEYCNQPLATGGFGFCHDHYPLRLGNAQWWPEQVAAE